MTLPKKTTKATAEKKAVKTVKKTASKTKTTSAAKKAPAKKAAATKTATKPKTTRVKKAAYTESVKAAATILFDYRALNIQLLDLRGIADEKTDFMILATCESEAQMQAILDELSKEFKAQALPHRTEYKPGTNMCWAVFDAGFDLMVQLFEENKRADLAFDKLYSDATITDLAEKDFVQKKSKKTEEENALV